MVDSGRLLLWFGFSLYFYDEPQLWMSHQKLFQKIVINAIQKTKTVDRYPPSYIFDPVSKVARAECIAC